MPAHTSTPSLPRAILTAGLLAGALDGLAAVAFSLIRGGQPIRVFNYIASAALGPSALAGGVPLALVGLLFHLTIAMGWTVLYFLAAKRLVALRQHDRIAAVGYGLFVWTLMNLVVVPLSRLPARPFDLTNAIIQALILVACIGFPASLLARRHFGRA